MITQQLLMLT